MTDAPVHAEISVIVNGERHALSVDTRTTLLDLLRERLGLTGAKQGCDHGQCGACTVLSPRPRAADAASARRGRCHRAPLKRTARSGDPYAILKRVARRSR
ncbi:MAG TPA: 2Fe-2S iron-sulfur cluster-binding protein [Solirubrobacteraceae bacterium]|nr:2Fe-2S iron-sulfur cluster-binding protein [Solirubrobacteraceae bacterium]